MHTKTQTDTVTENLKEGIGVFNPFGGGGVHIQPR